MALAIRERFTETAAELRARLPVGHTVIEVGVVTAEDCNLHRVAVLSFNNRETQPGERQLDVAASVYAHAEKCERFLALTDAAPSDQQVVISSSSHCRTIQLVDTDAIHHLKRLNAHTRCPAAVQTTQVFTQTLFPGGNLPVLQQGSVRAVRYVVMVQLPDGNIQKLSSWRESSGDYSSYGVNQTCIGNPKYEDALAELTPEFEQLVASAYGTALPASLYPPQLDISAP